MTGLRLLYGLERLPSTLAPNDARLPAVELDQAPLRLNSVPLPQEAWGSGGVDHAARMLDMRSWLLALCGDYNGTLRRAVGQYLDAIAAHVADHHEALELGLAPFEGLYRVEDWCWSALRPLPRAWWQRDGVWQRADLAFWDGNAVIAIPPRDFGMGELPIALQCFWRDQTLPVSPFRRAFPARADGDPLQP